MRVNGCRCVCKNVVGRNVDSVYIFLSKSRKSAFDIVHINDSLFEKGIVDMNDIESALAALAKEDVDAIYIPTDNVLANASATVHSHNIGE